jgi:hypothetical protein
MRSMVILVIFFLAASLCFGHGSLELSGGMPSYSQAYDNTYDIYHGYSLGLSSRIKIASIFGIGIHSNFIYFPKIVSGDSDAFLILKNGDCDLLFGFDFLMGPSFLLVDSNKFKMPLTIGFRGFGLAISIKEPYPFSTRKQEIDIFDFNFGLGFSLGAEFYITKRFYLFLRAQGGLDFLHFGTYKEKIPVGYGSSYNTTTDIDYGFSRMFSFNPQIGIGFQF